ncbi:MAG: hypothetical protein PHP65_01970 [Bacilli bacterium]|nr:hypothetical protein [Bacilli bacterium]
MDCNQKRTLLNLWEISSCEKCKHYIRDEHFTIGNQTIGIYHVFSGCQLLKEKNDYFLSHSKKLRILLKDAIMYQDKIFLLFVENLILNQFYDIFSQIMDHGFHVQIITL